MGDKTQRLIFIKKVIQKQKIYSQEELLEKLKKQGFNYTQATLSRDLKYLKVIKVPDEEGEYIYSLQEKMTFKNKTKSVSLSLEGFISITFSNHIGVIKTNSGYATGIASTIDRAAIYEVLGTVAGDDTIIVIPREGAKKSDILNSLIFNFPDLKNKLKKQNDLN